MWGGDLYFPEKQTWLHKQIIKNVKNVVTFIKQDYQYLIDNIKFIQNCILRFAI